MPYAAEYLRGKNDAFSLPMWQIVEALEICIQKVVNAVQQDKKTSLKSHLLFLQMAFLFSNYSVNPYT